MFFEEVTESTHDPFESDEEVEETAEESSLWGRLVRQYPSLTNVPFNQFASLDEDVVIEKQLTEKDATRET